MRRAHSPVCGKRFAVSLLLIAWVVSAGCSSSVYGWYVRTNSTVPAPAANKEMLAQAPVAVLGALGPGLGGAEIGISAMLTQVVKQAAPQAKLIDTRDVFTRINTNGAVDDYMRLRADALHGHILSRNPLQKVASAIGARYVFQPYVVAFSQSMTNRWSFADIRLVHTRSSNAKLSVQLWDAETGELLWASLAEAEVEDEGVEQEPVYLEDAVRIAFGSMMADFLLGKTASEYDSLSKYVDQLVPVP